MLCDGVGRESSLENVLSVFPVQPEAVLWSQLTGEVAVGGVPLDFLKDGLAYVNIEFEHAA